MTTSKFTTLITPPTTSTTLTPCTHTLTTTTKHIVNHTREMSMTAAFTLRDPETLVIVIVITIIASFIIIIILIVVVVSVIRKIHADSNKVTQLNKNPALDQVQNSI